jgi:uncharacterized membrane protein YdbT with pleckstrin-like domain
LPNGLPERQRPERHAELGRLRWNMIDLEHGHVCFPRPKPGVMRLGHRIGDRQLQLVGPEPPGLGLRRQTVPVARLHVPELNIRQLVLAGDTGAALAWGPGLVSSAPGLLRAGHIVIAGHRDTHFRFLADDGKSLLPVYSTILDVDAPATETVAQAAGDDGAGSDGAGDEKDVFARLRPGWVVYNIFNVWAYVMALGLLWGGYWLLSSVGLDVAGFARGVLDWDTLGWGWSVAIGVLAVTVLGVLGLAINFFTEHWGFELARVPGTNGTLLRTRQGLLKTREVNRDDARMRGAQIAEPVLWRWMGMADTTVITTGLSIWSMSQPTAILPRGPISVARPVTSAVLATEPNPLEAPLRGHPRAALRRRLWWATATASSVAGLIGWFVANDLIPASTLWAGVPIGLICIGAAIIAYQALGHAIVGTYLVVRSGLLSRTTAALQRPAVSTIAIRESLLQRRLGLKTVSAMTAAGYGAYEAPDLDADEAISFAADAAPGLLTPFLATNESQTALAHEARRATG